jgi:hypothetical protein
MNKDHLHVVAKRPDLKPLIHIDGFSGILIKDSHDIKIENFNIEGPALRITGEQASENRRRVTGVDSEDGCGWFDNY